MGAGPSTSDFDEAVAEVVADLHDGVVVSYGWVAHEAGYPGRHRAVGSFLARRFDGPNWWRVVGANGRLISPSAPEQAARLREEGVRVEAGRVVGPVKRPGTS